MHLFGIVDAKYFSINLVKVISLTSDELDLLHFGTEGVFHKNKL